jgi:acetylornithine deacetylase
MTTAHEHLLNLVGIDSVSSISNRGVIDYAAGVLRRAGWSSSEIPYYDAAGSEKINLIAAPPGQDSADPSVDLAFVCHTDTVPHSATWTNALSPFIRDGFLYGCGACDVKGFLACLLTAAAQIAPDNYAESLRIVLTADEEIGCLGAKHLLAQNALRPKRLVIGEPTSLRVARAGKGYCLAEITVSGTEAHSALPAHGSSAIYAASHLIQGIEQLGQRLESITHALFTPPFTTLNVGTIRGGSAKNIIPGQCTFLLEWRPIPNLPVDYVVDAVKIMIEEICSRDSRLKVRINILRQQAGFETSEDASLVVQLQDASGRQATSIPFGSEASVFGPVAEQAVVFGPGEMSSAHSDRECVSLAELDEAVGILQTLMVRG